MRLGIHHFQIEQDQIAIRKQGIEGFWCNRAAGIECGVKFLFLAGLQQFAQKSPLQCWFATAQGHAASVHQKSTVAVNGIEQLFDRPVGANGLSGF